MIIIVTKQFALSLLPPGETNMYVRFHGFPYDETRTYEDANFKIPFVKK